MIRCAPTLVFVIDQGIDEVANDAWEHCIAHVAGGLIVKLLCVRVDIGATVSKLECWKTQCCFLYGDIHYSGDLPKFNEHSHTCSRVVIVFCSIFPSHNILLCNALAISAAAEACLLPIQRRQQRM